MWKKTAIGIVFIRFINLDIDTGNDLESLRTDHFEKCEQACEYNSKCKSYIYNNKTKYCYLKSNLNGIKTITESTNVGIRAGG